MVQEKKNSSSEELPAWLDQKCFEDFLYLDFPDLKEIKSFSLEPSAGKGENYTTLMLRANFELELKDGSQESISYMAKLLPNSFNRDNVVSWKVFDKERKTYGTYIPEFEQLYREAGKEVSFGARYYELKNQQEEELIVLEDLGRRGFTNVNRQIGLDIPHTEATLEKLSQFHAASAVRFEQKGAYPEMYNRNLWGEEDSFKEFRVTQTKAYVESFPLYEANHLAKAVETFGKQSVDMFQAYVPNIEGEFRVLNHGDAWCNNVMYRYDEAGKLIETCFVDLQMSRFCSPAQDLLYLILSSTQAEIKIVKFDYLVQFYHKKLIENLKLLKYSKPLPSLRSLHQSIFIYQDWILPVVSILLPIVLVDKSDDANMDSLMDNEGAGDKFRNNLFRNPRMIKHQKVILPWAYNRGAFEVTN
ncbi:uncharacterized protein LOC108102017 [Drosophila ficusphila]|uniref:uncharacterized protein LOC108102017 n=1 Tax=Drosophila ficusphila TaxID=30025 RepID=UPI0007E5CCEF|nr:uncharacterized protein LOC108102017 [Drosophila ficusphila]